MNPQTYTAPQEQQEAPASFAAILPLLLFLLIFIGTGVSLSLAGVDMAFYQLSATVAILPAIALALMQGRARLSKKITIFLTGVGEINIITMCMIYLLAGGFAATATAIGSVDATVNFGLSLVPPAFILPGLFLIRDHNTHPVFQHSRQVQRVTDTFLRNTASHINGFIEPAPLF